MSAAAKGGSPPPVLPRSVLELPEPTGTPAVADAHTALSAYPSAGITTAAAPTAAPPPSPPPSPPPAAPAADITTVDEGSGNGESGSSTAMLAALVGSCAQETDDGSVDDRQEAARRLGKLASGACRIANCDGAAASGTAVAAVAGDITAAASSVTEGDNDTFALERSPIDARARSALAPAPGGCTLPCDREDALLQLPPARRSGRFQMRRYSASSSSAAPSSPPTRYWLEARATSPHRSVYTTGGS